MEEFWSDRRVLVTGATGFIGSWLTESLVKKNAKVTVLVKKDPLYHVLDHIKERLNFIQGDIRNKKIISKAVKDQDVIFHLAAITQVLYSIENPAETLEVNLSGTLNILESLRRGSDAFLVFASTDKVYGEPIYLPIDESHPLSAKSPYDASKVAADRLVYAYHKTYSLKAGIVRWSNTIGGRDSNILRIVPDTIVSLLSSRQPIIRGHGKHVRDYMYVEDAVSGVLAVAENQKITDGEVFNLGTENPTTVTEIVNLIVRLMGCKFSPLILNKPTPGEIDKQYLSYKKARKVLKWKPKFNLKQALRLTIDWYKNNPSWINVMKETSNFYGIKYNWI
jgi:dTDP-glucose 4,6-dehydratase